MCIYVLVYKNKLDEPGWQFLWLRPAEIRTNFWAKTIFKNVDNQHFWNITYASSICIEDTVIPKLTGAVYLYKCSSLLLHGKEGQKWYPQAQQKLHMEECDL